MCGIFGIISKQQFKQDEFTRLGELNKERGNLGFGGYMANISDTAVSEKIFRFPHPFQATLLPPEPVNVALGHIRAPTAARSDSIAELHPFAVDDLLLAHNGLLLNYWDFPQWQLNTAVTVDSQIILGGIHHYLQNSADIIAAIAKTVTHLEGQQACWLWSKRSQMLYLWRVMSPIYIQQTMQTFRFSSTKSDDINQLLAEGTIYQFDLHGMTLSPRGNFEFYSPYRV